MIKAILVNDETTSLTVAIAYEENEKGGILVIEPQNANAIKLPFKDIFSGFQLLQASYLNEHDESDAKCNPEAHDDDFSDIGDLG